MDNCYFRHTIKPVFNSSGNEDPVTNNWQTRPVSDSLLSDQAAIYVQSRLFIFRESEVLHEEMPEWESQVSNRERSQ
jgi:hypothetical protein